MYRLFIQNFGGNTMYLLAVDIGSTTIKSIIFDYEGHIISEGRRKTEVFLKEDSGKKFAFWMPDNIWSNVCGAIKESVNKITDARQIKSITITGFACDGLPLDKEGNWIYPFISWHDSRTIEQVEWFKNNFSFEEAYLINGQKPWLYNTIFRILWVKLHLPDIYKKIHKWLLIEDYVNFKLCETIATDYSLASTTLMLDQKDLKWSRRLFDFFDIEEDIFPDPGPSGSFLGEVTKDAAADTGLIQGTPVILGGLDGLCGVYAAAGEQQENLVGVVGTYEHYHKCLDRPVLKKNGLDLSMICQAHVVKDKYDVYGVSVTSGVLEWYKDNFCAEEIAEAQKTGKNIWSILMNKAEKSTLGSNGLFMLPDIFGSTCPVQDNYSRGVFIGINSNTNKEDFLRSIVEAISYKGIELYDAVKKYTDSEGSKIILTGGAIRNEFWMQTKADMFGKPIEIPEIEEATPLGAAMIGGVGIGVYKNFEDAFLRIKRTVKNYYPDEKRHKIYMDFYKNIFEKIYHVCRDLNTIISTSFV